MAPPHILIFTKTLGYRHDSIPIAGKVPATSTMEIYELSSSAAKVVADWGNNTSAWTSVHTEE